MQQNPTTPNAPKEKTEHARHDAILRKLRSIFLENWGTKLLALVIAIALWAGLITQDPSLTREKQFTDVSVSVTGAETLVQLLNPIVNRILQGLTPEINSKRNNGQLQFLQHCAGEVTTGIRQNLEICHENTLLKTLYSGCIYRYNIPITATCIILLSKGQNVTPFPGECRVYPLSPGEIFELYWQ